MKNKQIYKFLLLFFVCFTIFLNDSFCVEYDYVQGSITSVGSTSIAGYTVTNTSFANMVRSSVDSGTISSDYQNVIDDILTATNTSLYIGYKNGDGYYHCYFYNPSDIQIIRITNPPENGYTDFIKFYYINSGSIYYDLYIYKNSGADYTNRFTTYTVSAVGYININNSSFWSNIYGNGYIEDYVISNNKIVSTGNYFYGSAGNSNPSFSFTTSLTDNEIIDVVNNFYASDVFNVPSGYKDFIICYNEYSHDYFVLTYKNTENLSKRVIDIPADYFDVNFSALDYDTWMLIFGYENANLWQRLFPGVTISDHFYCYSSSDGVTFVSEGVRYFVDFEEDLRFSTEQPIIYSTQDLDVVIMTATGTSEVAGTYYTDENNPISQTNIVGYENIVTNDGEGNPLKQVLNELKKIPLAMASTIAQVLDGFFNLAENTLDFLGVNIVTLVFAILIKTITVFVASIALILRFTAFILTLVAIPASSSLLAVDVATNSSGLAFTGLNWGSNLISGLNMIKSFTWNGLSLWTLFEVFVSSLEVIILVKVIRKHYQAL